jgi:hypothetical protein
MAKDPTPSLPAEVISEVISSDDALAARARGLVGAMFDEIEHILDPRYGAPAATRQKIVVTALPAILRELREEKVDDRLAMMQAQQQELMASIRAMAARPGTQGQVGSSDGGDGDGPVIPVDGG